MQVLWHHNHEIIQSTAFTSSINTTMPGFLDFCPKPALANTDGKKSRCKKLSLTSINEASSSHLVLQVLAASADLIYLKTRFLFVVVHV